MSGDLKYLIAIAIVAPFGFPAGLAVGWLIGST